MITRTFVIAAAASILSNAYALDDSAFDNPAIFETAFQADAAQAFATPDRRLRQANMERLIAGETPQFAQSTGSNVAIGGYDPVSYFHDGEPLEGKAEYSVTMGETVVLFGSENHRQMFLSDPEHFLPMFGGYDPEELRNGRLVAADPLQWSIIDNRLYLSADKDSASTFHEHERETIRIAIANWRKFESDRLIDAGRAHAKNFSGCRASGGVTLDCGELRQTVWKF